MPRSTIARAALTALTLVALAACSSQSEQEESGSEPDATTESSGLVSGIPAEWAPSIDDGLERYPDIGREGRGDVAWDCPLEPSVDVDERSQESSMTIFWKLPDGVYEVECKFYPPTPVSLLYAQAEDEDAFAELEDATGAFEQVGNTQVEDELTVGERTFTTVTWEFPTNPEAGTKYVACYLDEDELARACLEVANSGERSDDYDAEQAAQDLSEILSST